MTEKFLIFKSWTKNKLVNHLSVSIDFLFDYAISQGD